MVEIQDFFDNKFNKPIFLIGFMGCGKSTIGKKIANKLSIDYVDLDFLIEDNLNMKISEIFKVKGENGFREIESKTLKGVNPNNKFVIATGGGAPCYFDNMNWMNSNGITIFLNPPIPILFSRLKNGKIQRPLIAEKSDEELLNFIKTKLDERLQFYNKAKIILNGSDIKVNDIIEAIKNLD